jgi:hypothetical protein
MPHAVHRDGAGKIHPLLCRVGHSALGPRCMTNPKCPGSTPCGSRDLPAHDSQQIRPTPATLLAVLLTAGYGWHEITLREAYDLGRAGAPRGAPNDNGPQRPQVPLYTDADLYSLTPDQVRILLQEFPKLKPLINAVIFSRAPSDLNAYSYWLRMHDVLTRSGLPSDLRVSSRADRKRKD